MKLLTVTFILLCSIIWMKKISCQDYTGTGGTAISGSGNDGTTGTDTGTGTGTAVGTGTSTGVDSNSPEEGCDGDSNEDSDIENFRPSRPGQSHGRNNGMSQRRKMKGRRSDSEGGEKPFGKFSKKRHGQNKNEKPQKLSRPRQDD